MNALKYFRFAPFFALMFAAMFLVACAGGQGDGGSEVGGSISGDGAAGVSFSERGGGFRVAASGGAGVDVASSTSSEVIYLSENVADRVYFATNRSDLTPQARAVLQIQAAWVRAQNANILIEGHSDERGTREYNLALASRRANVVRSFLISQGVAPDRVATISYGKERPVALCSRSDCWEKNRRVVSVVR